MVFQSDSSLEQFESNSIFGVRALSYFQASCSCSYRHAAYTRLRNPQSASIACSASAIPAQSALCATSDGFPHRLNAPGER